MTPCEKILEIAREREVDLIGLSGPHHAVPSTKWPHVASEMQRQGFTVPLLIGGATTSKAHTSVKIAPHYGQSVVHVLDASRAVGVVGQLINPELRLTFDAKNRDEQEKIRVQHSGPGVKLISLAEARRRAPKLDYAELAQPDFTGVRVVDVPLADLVPLY